MSELEQYFHRFRNNIIGINAEIETPYGCKKLVYADWIASGRLYDPIEKRIVDEIGPMVGNTHSESTATGRAMTEAYRTAQKIVKDHVNAGDEDVLLFTGTGMTSADFGPTLFTEKLKEREGITASRETVRIWLLEAGEWKKHRKHKAHRQWRERKDHYGEMLQMDGSHHDWFEGRGPKCVLMASIDDATGIVHARFYEYEGTIPAMDSFKRYVTQYGVPMSVYLDKHTTYKSWVRRDDFRETEPMSQFGRALQELGVRKLHAHSPQAKGRIERLFKTFQDRLVKEMRLRGIGTIDEANDFLASYLPVYNKRFSIAPKKQENLHHSVTGDLDTVLCIKTERTLNNDHTIKHNRRLYQIDGRIRAKTVIVEELIDGTMRIRHKGAQVKFHEIMERPAKPEKERPYLPKGKGHRPPLNHSWRPPWYGRSAKQADCGNMEKASPLPPSHSTATDAS